MHLDTKSQGLKVLFFQNSKKFFGLSKENWWEKEIDIPIGFDVNFFYIFELSFLKCLKSIVQNYQLINQYKVLVSEQDGNAGVILCIIKQFGFMRKSKIVIRGFISNEKGYHFYDHIKYFIQKIILRGADLVTVFSTNEIKYYHKNLNLDLKRLCFVPLEISSKWFSGPINNKPQDEHYIVACGRTRRDFATFFKAVNGINGLKAIVVADPKSIESDLYIPGNVEIKYNIPFSEFDKLVSNSLFGVLPLQDTPVSVGERVCLHFMARGKAQVVTDVPCMADYLSHGKDALKVPPNDNEALRDAIKELLVNHELRERLSTQAHMKAESFQANYTFNLLFTKINELLL
jgi:glycosyltransferase involved in cell wall biosynthesis